MTRKGFIRRIAVGSVAGVNSPILRVWATRNKSDVYVSFREIASAVKISLHEGGECHSGLTSEFAADEQDVVLAGGGSRHQHRWKRRTHLGSHSSAVLHICFPHSEFRTWRTKPVTEKNVTWLPSPSEKRSVIVSCIYTGCVRPDDKWPDRDRGAQLLGSEVLPNGEKLWLVWRESATTPIEMHIIQEVRRIMASRSPLKFKQAFPGAPMGPRLTAFGHDPDLEGYIVVDLAAEAEPLTP